jgi:hypothetical protein
MLKQVHAFFYGKKFEVGSFLIKIVQVHNVCLIVAMVFMCDVRPALPFGRATKD